MTLSTHTPAHQDTPPPPPRRGLRPLILRLHFYAGILVAPFILVAAISGGLYAVATPLEKLVHADELAATTDGPPLPLAEQIAAAREAEPDLPLLAVRPAAPDDGGVGETTRVLFDDGQTEEFRRLAVFVDPATGEVRGALTSYGGSGSLPVRTWIDEMHRHLHLGEPGRLYSELAASWLGVIALAGLALWFTGPRRGSRLRPLRRSESRSPRRRTLSWHGAVGTWALLGFLMLSATGLTWSTYAGANVTELRTALSWNSPAVTSDLSGDHSGGDHSGHGGGAEGVDPDVDEPGVGFDGAASAAAGEGLSGPVEITRPVGDTGTYVVSEIDNTWPTRGDVVSVDPADGEVVDVVRFADWPFVAKLASWGIDLHMGVLFGVFSQVALVLLAATIVAMTIWGYRMWWLRRPTRGAGRPVGRAPRRGAWTDASRPQLVGVGLVALVVGWFVPLLGLSLAAFLVVDLVLAARSRRRVEGGADAPATVVEQTPDDTLEDAR